MESRDLRTFKTVRVTVVRRSFGFGLMPFAQDDNIFPEWDQFKQRLHNSPLFLDGKYGIINYYDEFDGRENHAAL